MNLEDYKLKNKNLIQNIEQAERNQDYESVIGLKRELYNNKIKMLDLLTVKNEKLTITAGALRDKVNAMKPAIRYETGIRVLDENLKGGFEVGSLIQLAGQSFAGKTTLFLQIVANIAEYNKSVFFSFEMGDRRIVKRLNYLLTKEQQWSNLLINSQTRNINDLVMEITLLADDGVKFFAIDSRMKLSKDGSEAEYQKIALMSKMLSECAIKNDIIILVINQISEEDLKNGRFSLKGSGDQLYDSDMALFMTVGENDVRHLFCTKNRQDEHTFKIDLPKEYNKQYNHVETVYEDIPKVEMSVL